MRFIRKFMYVILLICSLYNTTHISFTNKDSSGYFYNISVYINNYMWSLANTIFAMGDRDYLMIRVMLVSHYVNFWGNLYKIVTGICILFLLYL